MSQILDHRTQQVTSRDENGDETTAERVVSVTFVDQRGAVHTLQFPPAGTDVAGEAEDGPRIVGEHVPEFVFTDPRDAVTAYERGEVQ